MLLPIEHRNRSKTVIAATHNSLGELLLNWLGAGLKGAYLYPEFKGGSFNVTFKETKRRGKPRLEAEAEVKWRNGKIIVTGLSSDFASVSNWRWLELGLKDMWHERGDEVGSLIREAIRKGAGAP